MTTFQHFLAWCGVSFVLHIAPIPFTSILIWPLMTVMWLLVLLLGSRPKPQQLPSTPVRREPRRYLDEEEEPVWNL